MKQGTQVVYVPLHTLSDVTHPDCVRGFVIGILALLAGLIIAGFSAFWVKDFSHWVGGLLLVCAIGFLFTEWNGMFSVGLALLALGVLKGTRS